MQAAKAKEVEFETEHIAAVKAAQQAEVAKIEAAQIAQARQDAKRLTAERLEAQQQMQAQVDAVARPCRRAYGQPLNSTKAKNIKMNLLPF